MSPRRRPMPLAHSSWWNDEPAPPKGDPVDEGKKPTKAPPVERVAARLVAVRDGAVLAREATSCAVSPAAGLLDARAAALALATRLGLALRPVALAVSPAAAVFLADDPTGEPPVELRAERLEGGS